MNVLRHHIRRAFRQPSVLQREQTRLRSRLLRSVAAVALALATAAPMNGLAQEIVTRDLPALALPADRVVVKFSADASPEEIQRLIDQCGTGAESHAATQNVLGVRVETAQSGEDAAACFAAQPDLVDWATPSPVITENPDGQLEQGDLTLVLASEPTCMTESGTSGESCRGFIGRTADLLAYVLIPFTTPAGPSGASGAAAPKPNQCQVFSTIMAIAGRLDVLGAAFAPVDAVATIGSLGAATVAQKLAKEGGERITKAQVKEVLADLVREFLKDKALDAAKDLLGDPFNTGLACRALAQCETTLNGNNVGKHVFYNAFGNEMAKCVWRAPNVSYKRLGLQHRIGIIDFDDEP